MLTRDRISSILLAITFVLVFVTGPVLYVSSVVADEDAFVSVADDIIDHPEVRLLIAETVTTVTLDAVGADEAVAEILPEAVRPFSVPLTRIAAQQLTQAAFAILDTEVAVDARDAALREIHTQVTTDNDVVVLDLRAALVRTSRELGGPAVGAGVAKFVADSEAGQFTLAEADSTESNLFAVVRAIPAIGLTLAMVTILTVVAGIAIATDRRRALIRFGLAIAAAAILSTMVVSVALSLVLGGIVRGSAVGQAVAEVITVDLAQQQRGAVINGFVLAFVGLLLGDRPAAVALRALPGDVWHRRRSGLDRIATIVSDNPPLARVAVWVATIGIVVGWPNPTRRVVVTTIVLGLLAQAALWTLTSATSTAAGWRERLALERAEDDHTGRLRANVAILAVVLLLFWPAWGWSVIVRFVIALAIAQVVIDLPGAYRRARADDEAPETSQAEGAETKVRAAGTARSRRGLILGGAVMAGTVAAGVLATTGSVDRAEAAVGCNGHVALCDRRVDEVVFAGSHNAMSSNDLGWQLAMQTGDMVAQLDVGIRALLIDALYWDNTGRLDGDGEAEDSGAAAVIESALSDDTPRAGTWLCHGFCALGATDLTAGLASINSWLDANPREVLLIVVQDEISTADVMAAFERSDLVSKVHDHEPGTPFPTLGDLIDSGERVMVYAENEGSPDSWYQNAWESAFTETPYTFAVRSDFSCIPNRGDDANPLFLINHWLTTGIPVREAAASVNSTDSLLERVGVCTDERGRPPTVLAVDFVETGDLVAVVDQLNGVTSSSD